jgi:hypothetical protein
MREGAMEGSERGLFCQDCSGGRNGQSSSSIRAMRTPTPLNAMEASQGCGFLFGSRKPPGDVVL